MFNSLQSIQNIFSYDSLPSSHAISIPVNLPDEINQIFDDISYKKGGSVIRMMANFLGIDTFNKGVTNYLHANAYSNADQDDLWGFLTAAGQEDGSLTDLSVKEIMDTWTVQMGYPVVDIKRNTDGTVSASQNRFLLTPITSNETDNNPYTWWVPLSFTTPSGGFAVTAPQAWLNPANADADTEIDVSALPSLDTEPLIANVQQTGFYRVNYDLDNWGRIRDALKSDHEKINR